MVNAVVILGAGSSAPFGVPVLSDIFTNKQAREYLVSRPALHKTLQDTIWDPRGLNAATANLGPTMEDILTMLRDWENAHARDESGVPSPPDLVELRRSLYCLIQRAVFEGKSSDVGRHLNPLIEYCKSTFDHVTWATFNWDCIFESSFYYSSDLPWPAGLRSNPSVAVQLKGWNPGNRKHVLLKLHGGINWWMIDGRLTYLRWGPKGDLSHHWEEYDKGANPGAEPVILEPSVYKYGNSPAFDALKGQWGIFLHRLIEAEYVVVVGYSLPDLDSYAREAMLVAFQLNPSCKWLIVDPSQAACQRYTRLFGTKQATTCQMTLTDFNKDMSVQLEKAFPALGPVASTKKVSVEEIRKTG